jgi:hypothetical protein
MRVKSLILLIINFFTPKNKKKIFCFPDPELLKDKIDLLNYSADNTLAFLNWCIGKNKFEFNHFVIVCFDKERYSVINNFIKNIGREEISLVLWLSNNDKVDFLNRFTYSIKFYYCFFTSKFIISSNVLMQFDYKVFNQIYVSLNYFTPFKFDKQILRSKNQISYAISTSFLSSQIVSITSKIPFTNFLNLGFSRNDSLIYPRFNKVLLIEKLGLDFNSTTKIITYAPTHRYHINYGVKELDVLGYYGGLEKVEQFLNNNNSILLIKIHPSQRREVISDIQSDRIFILNPSYEYTLYDVLSHTDILLTDYSSTYFDFLLLDRPVIFNFPDIENYKAERGFSFEPIETICAGIIVKTAEELVDALSHCLNSNFENKKNEKLKIVKSLIHKYHDGNSSERINNFITELIKNK